MKTDSIIKILEGFYGKKTEYTDTELNRIETLTINRINPDKTLANVDFSDLLKFKNLRRLTIDGCVIDINVMAYISTVTNLYSLSLFNCDIVDDIYSFLGNSRIKALKICNTNFDLSLLTGYYERLTLVDVPLKKFKPHVEVLNLYNCDITNFEELLDYNFEELVISIEQYDKYEKEFNECGRRITVMEDNGQFVYKKVGFISG